MAKVKYLLQSNKTESTIYLRLSLSKNVSFKRRTGLIANPKSWSSATGLPKQNTPINKNLSSQLKSLDNFIIEKINTSTIKGELINGVWLQKQIDIFFNRIKEHGKSELLIDAIQNIIDTAQVRKNAKGSIGLSNGRVKAYKVLKNMVMKYQGKNYIHVKDVNIAFGTKFLNYLLVEKKYSQSYAAKKLSDVKVACYEAEINGIEVSPQLKRIEGVRGKNEFIIYLTKDDLKKITDAKIILKSLKNARKWLLLGCSIGQRGGDLLALTLDNFITRNGLEVIELKQQKTGKNITIPVLKATKDILKEGLPYKISLEKLNEHIKTVCKISEIDQEIEGKLLDSKLNRRITGVYPKWKLVSSHICRRSFATNQYGILPTPLIMQITGHSTEKVFLGYIGKNSLDFAQQIADFYNLQEQKEKKEPQLKIIKKVSGE